MAVVRPFRGLRFREAADDLGPVLAPSTGEMSAEEREAWAARSDFNTVLLSQPEGLPDDRSKYIRYARSAARIAEWRRSGTLAADPEPAFYRVQIDQTPLVAALVRIDEIGALETTTVKRRDERLRVIEAAQTYFDLPVVVVNDPDGSWKTTINSANGTLLGQGDFGGSRVTVESLGPVDGLEGALGAADLFLISGADTLAAAAAFRESFGEKAFEILQDRLPVYLISSQDAEGLVAPYHRTVARGGRSLEEIVQALSEDFTVVEIALTGLETDELAPDSIVLVGDSRAFHIELGDANRRVDGFFDEEQVKTYFGIDKNPSISYTHLRKDALHAANEGRLAILVPSIPLSKWFGAAPSLDLASPAVGRLTLPVPSGLLFWSFRDGS